MGLNKRLIDQAGGAAAESFLGIIQYTGDGQDNRSLTGFGIEPDFVWIKLYGGNWGWTLVDRVRGTNATGNYAALATNSAGAEDQTNTFGAVKTLDSDGYTIKDGTDINGYYAVNRNGEVYHAYGLKAGGAAVSNTNGSITSQVSANQDAGFSIVGYTGNDSIATIGHGLNSAPELIIVKNLSITKNWYAYAAPMTADYYFQPNTTDLAENAVNNIWNDTEPTSTVFTVGDNNGVNDTNDYIAYCFHSVEGVQKVGSYSGNGSTTGPIVNVGFEPRFVLIKGATGLASEWYIWDSVQDATNPRTKMLRLNNSGAYIDDTNRSIDFQSTGFQLKTDYYQINDSSQTYIYLAIA